MSATGEVILALLAGLTRGVEKIFLTALAAPPKHALSLWQRVTYGKPSARKKTDGSGGIRLPVGRHLARPLVAVLPEVGGQALLNRREQIIGSDEPPT